ncbi:MAG: DUF368 domain-containing protein [Clostridia bacterium]|nr:DUF368 domain-containing protein [Clostridia bacterium]
MDEQSEEIKTEAAEPEKEPEKEVQEGKKKNPFLNFLYDVLRGIGIGIAFIIPGFSGGSVAAILGVYERLVGAVADIFKHFKKSIVTLIPILIGMLVGIAALILPIQWGLRHYPIPTVTLFVGLAIGGIPSVGEKLKGAKFSWQYALAFLIPLLAAAALCFLPLAGNVDLFKLNVGGYFLLVLIGAVGSCALVVPGISGSMLLLIFGYYNPIVELITVNLLHGQNVGICFAVLGCLAVGLVAGFFAISVLMKTLLKKCPRGTYYSILGFIIGSIPAIYVSTIREAKAEIAPTTLSALNASPWYWVVAVVLLIVGFALSFGFWWYSKKKKPKNQETP